jgi:hypothetical protein
LNYLIYNFNALLLYDKIYWATPWIKRDQPPTEAPTKLTGSLSQLIMDVRFTIDKQHKIISGVVSGPLHRDILLNLLAQLRVISANNTGCNLLFDLSRTSLKSSQMDLYRVIDVVSAIVDLKEQLGEKIAHVVPDSNDRVEHAEDIGSVAMIRGLNYKVFTDKDQAWKWLQE